VIFCPVQCAVISPCSHTRARTHTLLWSRPRAYLTACSRFFEAWSGYKCRTVDNSGGLLKTVALLHLARSELHADWYRQRLQKIITTLSTSTALLMLLTSAAAVCSTNRERRRRESCGRTIAAPLQLKLTDEWNCSSFTVRWKDKQLSIVWSCARRAAPLHGEIIYFANAAVAVDSSHMSASSFASWCRFSPPSNFVNGHVSVVSTMWFTVCHWWPQSQKGDWARPHLCKLERHGSETVHQRPWHVWRGRSKPGCRIVDPTRTRSFMHHWHAACRA